MLHFGVYTWWGQGAVASLIWPGEEFSFNIPVSALNLKLILILSKSWLCFSRLDVSLSGLGQLSWVKFFASMWITMTEAHYTEFLMIIPSKRRLAQDQRYSLMVFGICGGAPSTEVTPIPKREKDAFSVEMWVRISLKRLTLLRKDITSAGGPGKGLRATTRHCVPTARSVGMCIIASHRQLEKWLLWLDCFSVLQVTPCLSMHTLTRSGSQ